MMNVLQEELNHASNKIDLQKIELSEADNEKDRLKKVIKKLNDDLLAAKSQE